MMLLRAALMLLCLLAPVAHADYERDPYSATIARESWNLIGRTEQTNNIPAGLLHAMSLTETGQGMSGWMMPWPYTVGVNSPGKKDYLKLQHALNDLAWFRKMGFARFDVSAGGKSVNGLKVDAAAVLFNLYPTATSYTIKPQPYGRRFANAVEARAFVDKMFSFGHKNLDLGLMQINYKVHGSKFRSVNDLFNPVVNVNYAASYLLEHKQTRDWWGSVGRYHSATPTYARKYITSVYKWYKRVHDFNNGRQIAAR
ncbi:MAG: transglycosylase SLT domain-containing protein [Alphaproteobacteria bacterium]